MNGTYIVPFEMRISPIDSCESQLSIDTILVFRRQILMPFMMPFQRWKLVHKILSAVCSIGGGIECMNNIIQNALRFIHAFDVTPIECTADKTKKYGFLPDEKTWKKLISRWP